MNIMKNLKIRAKLVLIFVVLLVLLLSISGGAFFMTNRLSWYYDQFYENQHTQTVIVDQMELDVETMLTNAAYALQETDPSSEYMAADIEGFRSAITSFEAQLSEWDSKYGISSNEKMQAINDMYKAVAPYNEEFLNACSKADMNSAIGTFFTNVKTPLLELEAAIEELDGIIDEDVVAQVSHVQEISKLALNIMYALVAISLVAAAILGPTCVRAIRIPVVELNEAAKRLANGDLNVDIAYESKDELGQLANSMKKMSMDLKSIIADIDENLDSISDGNLNVNFEAEYVGDYDSIRNSIDNISMSLSETMQKIGSASSQVSANADHVSNASQNLAQGATEQASAVEELSATIRDIYNQTQTNSDNARHVASAVNDAGDAINTSNEKMRELKEAMEDMTEKSNEISKIVKTIEDIAFQTNILALNAAVEAARAGAAGKGFAVVADEVRNLATKSSDAASETTKLIGETITAINNGSKLASATAEDLQQVAVQTGAVVTDVNAISSASDAQSAAVSQVTLGIEQISTVVSQNSATSEESAAASQQLNAEARSLQELVEHFQIRG